MKPAVTRWIAMALLFAAGLAALSWQVLWQLDLALALGVSAQGTALTVATVMAGMMAGALLAARRLAAAAASVNSWRCYAAFELGIGLAGWLPRLAMPGIEAADAWAYAQAPALRPALQVLLLSLTLGPASLLLGATLPVIGLLAQRCGASLSSLYAANTLGAAVGAWLVAQWLLPLLGRFDSAAVVASVDVVVAMLAWGLGGWPGSKASPSAAALPATEDSAATEAIHPQLAMLFSLTTGVVTFVLEVAWFRMLRAAWLSTSDAFAIMLACFLTALAAGAALAKTLRHPRASLPVLLCLAAVAILIATPVVERFDGWSAVSGSYERRWVGRFLAALAAMGPGVLLLGMSLPALLDRETQPRRWARLYALNTLGAVAGSLLAGWCLLEWLGPVATCWAAALALALVGLPTLTSATLRVPLAVLTLLALGVAWAAQSGIGSQRVPGPTALVREAHRVLAHRDGPDVSTSLLRTAAGASLLFIDGYAATGEAGVSTAYMDAMARVPMLLHPSPSEVLVICFGTGQTVRAAIDEQPAHAVVVDVNAAVFDFAQHFTSNRNVLHDPRLEHHLMDGRAWLRRESQRQYDLITLEPMPPFFAGSNALYSVEFYELARARLRAGGMVAQWFPLHLLTPGQAEAVAAAFVQVFPQSLLWLDPQGLDRQGNPQQGILIGFTAAPASGLDSLESLPWPGLQRPADSARPYSAATLRAGLLLGPQGLANYIGRAQPVTDDNQSLSFGSEALTHRSSNLGAIVAENLAKLRASR